MDLEQFVWVTEHVAVNLALITRITIEPRGGTVRLLDVRGACTPLEGDEAARFLTWFNRRAQSSRNGEPETGASVPPPERKP